MTILADNEIEIAIGCVGSVARDAIRESHDGRVAAVFRHSFYLETAAGFCCVCTPGLGFGPLNMRARVPARTEWPAVGIRPDDPVRYFGEKFRVGSRFDFSCLNAVRWTPPVPPPPPSPAIVKVSLDCLMRLAGLRHPKDGLSMLVLSDDAVACAAALARLAGWPVRRLSEWLGAAFDHDARAVSDDCRWLEPLVGLGPGLTPSGDDLLAGAMIALKAFGRDLALAHLGGAVAAIAPRATNPISAAHLGAAAAGQGQAAVHDLLAAVLAGETDRLPRCLDAVGRIGHSSGWDALAGVTLVLRAYARSEKHRRRAA